jgi:S-DNA-T family DNA segregation ATPase FtsK/SpoIIIE
MFDLFRRKRQAWTTPGGQFFTLYKDMTEQPHLLIAGATGSGKSVVINGIMHTLLTCCTPCGARFVLIDPKRVELSAYRHIPHVLRYASEPGDMIDALEAAMDETERRYRAMQKKGVRKYSGADLYVVIDELADLMTTDKKHVQPLLQRLCQIGRAARVHVIAATQCPLSAVIPTPIKVNFDARVALRTRSAQDSRNILGVTGCEQLPRYGQGYYMTPEGTTLYNIPYIKDEEIAQLATYWTRT